MTTRSDYTSWSWVCGALALVILATLTPQPGPEAGADFFGPFIPERTSQWRDVVQNVVLYLPVGMLLGVRRASALKAVLFSAVVSLAIELAQYVVPGRDPIARDVVTNTLGGAIGWWLAQTHLGALVDQFLKEVQRALVAVRVPGRRRAIHLSLMWAAVVTSATSFTCWLISPDLPPPVYFGVASSSIDPPRGVLRIGGYATGNGSFNGLIDEVRIYTRARSSGEVVADMDRPVARDRAHSDLVAAYGFDSDLGITVLDASGSTRPTFVREATWVAEGRFGGALSFNGRTSQVVVSEAGFDLSRGLTVEAWVFLAQPQDQDALVIADANDAFFLRATSNESSLPLSGVRFSGAPRMVRPRASLPLRKWTHIATTYDGRFLRMYVNAALAGVFPHWSTHQPSQAVLNGTDLPFGVMRDPQSLPSILLDDFSLDVTVRCGAPQEQQAPFFLIAGIQSIDALELMAAGSEVAVRFPRNGQRLGLAFVDHRVPGALAGCAPGETRRILVRGPLQRSHVLSGGDAEMPGVRPGIASAWGFLLDSQQMPLWLVTALSGCYLAALVFPFGLWASNAGSVAVGVVTLVANLVVPRLWDLQTPGGFEIFAIVVGVALGLMTAARVRRAAATGETTSRA